MARIALLLSIALLAASSARAQDAASPSPAAPSDAASSDADGAAAPVDERHSPHALDDLAPDEVFDTRDRLSHDGIEFSLGYGATFMGNPVGGNARGVAYAGLMTAGLTFDLEKLYSLSGTTFYVSSGWGSGSSLTKDKIGNAFDVSNVFQGDALQLYEMYVDQKVLDGELELRVGRLSTGNAFAISPLYDVFVSFAFNANPVSLVLNDLAFWVAPDAAWAALLDWEPGSGFYTKVGAYNGSPRDIGRPTSHGTDFSFDPGNSILVIGEAGYEIPGHGADDSRGWYRIGGYYDTGELPTVADPSVKQSGMYNLYALVDQELIDIGGDSSNESLSGFVTFAIAPDEELNLFPLFTSAGLVYTGLFASRPDDQTGVAFGYGTYSRDAPDNYEMTIEATHLFAVTPWLQVQPDLQVVVHPGIDTALVLGAAMSIAF